MRTTLTIDDDVADSLKEQARQRKLPLRRVVNDVLRRGLEQEESGQTPNSNAESEAGAAHRESDPKYYKRILEEEDIQHYLKVRDDIDAANPRRIEEVVFDQEMIERFHRPQQ